MLKNINKDNFLYNQRDFDSLISSLSSEYLTIAPGNVEKVINHWFINISESLKAERTVFCQKNPKGDYYLSYTWTKEGIEAPVEYNPNKSFPYIASVIAKGNMIVYASPDDLPYEAQSDKLGIEKMGIKSFLLFPMGSKSSVWGAFLFAFRTKKVKWDETFINRLRFIIHLFSSVIKREVDRKSLENKAQFENILADLSRDFVSISHGEIGERITYWLHKTAEVLQFDRALVFNLIDDKFFISTSWKSEKGKDIAPYDPEEVFPWMDKQLRNNKIVIIPDIAAFPPEAETDKKNMPLIGAQSVLVLPLFVQDQMVGALAFSCRKPMYNLHSELAQRVQIVSQVFASALLQQKTERTLEEEKERLAVTLESIGDGVITTDTSGNITLLNSEAERITGWGAVEAQGKRIDGILVIVDERTGLPLESPVFNVLYPGSTPTRVHQSILMDRGKNRKIISASTAPIRNKEGGIIGSVFVFRDISLEKRKEEELLKLKKLKSIGILAGGIAHDFNNLLTGIVGNIDLAVLSGKDIDQAHSYLKNASEGCRRAASLTQRLLTFSKGGAPVKENASIGEIITESTDFILHGSSINTNVSIPDNLWETKVDREQISQVIQNLILNSMEAMPSGGTISISCKNLITIGNDQREHRYIQIKIKDSGTGIKQESLNRIFDPYYSTKATGSGLGLAVTFSIINKHDGFIEVKSEPGKGTEFFIHLPVCESIEKEITGNDRKQTAYSKISCTILVMDDEKSIRKLLTSMLTSLKHSVTAVENGKEAVEAYKKNKFDLVILDITIPGGMGGLETIKELKKINPNVRAIVSSGYANSPVLARYTDYGFSGALAKPFHADDLKEIIEKVISS